MPVSSRGQLLGLLQFGTAVVVMASLLSGLFNTTVRSQERQESPSIQFSEHLIADDYAYAYGIAAADFDKDGDLDLSSADYTPHNKLYLFENDSDGNFTKLIIQKDEPTRIERHQVGDVDGDGDLDIVIVKNLNGNGKPDIIGCSERTSRELRWWKNEGRLPTAQ